MRIYKLEMGEAAQILEPLEGYKIMNMLDENLPAPFVDWPGLELQQMELEEQSSLCLTDINAVGMSSNYPLCSPRVRDTLTKVCGVTGQWLDVSFAEKGYTMLNLTHVIDALDHERSTKEYLKTSGDFHKCSRFAFHLETVENEWLFRDKTDRHKVFCTTRFVELAAEEGWTGPFFRPVWDSDHAPFMHFPTKTEIRTRPDVFGPEGFIKGYENVWPEEWHEGQVSDVKREH